jgi:hypothetical protein
LKITVRLNCIPNVVDAEVGRTGTAVGNISPTGVQAFRGIIAANAVSGSLTGKMVEIMDLSTSRIISYL